MKNLILFLFFLPLSVYAGEAAICASSSGCGSYEDGDLIWVISDHRILNTNVQGILNWRERKRDADGYLMTAGPLEDYYARSHKYRFDRISETEVLRTDLETLETDTLSNSPNKDGEQIDVKLFLKRRLKNKDHNVFCCKGFERWYGHRIQTNELDLIEILNSIEIRQIPGVDWAKWQFSPREKRRFLLIDIDDITDDQAAEFMAPLTKTEGDDVTVVKARKYNVDWRTKLGFTLTQITRIETRSGSLDFRTSGEKDTGTIIDEKTVIAEAPR